MFSKLTSNQKILLISSGLLIFISLLIFVVLILIFRSSSATEEAKLSPIIKIAYCGAEPEEICLLAFGHDVNGNAIINFFVPDEDFPDFYLNIIRKDSETIYLCVQDEADSSLIICRGEVLNLGEQVEIQMMFAEDYQLFASGEFMIKAILLMPQGQGIPQGSAPESTETNTPTVESSEISETETPQTTPETPTVTPSVSYPNYP